ncbi:mammalian cell entry protein, partial [Mycobacterium sp. CBMA361]|nr:mammalian cell entry protein [Mycolicibacterium sp. CBMA 361]
MNTRWSRYLVGVGLVATLVSTSGCSSWRGLNSLPMPGTQ